MIRVSWLVFFLFLACHSVAQVKVKFEVKETTVLLHDSIYIAGNFNDWDSTANPKYRLQGGADRVKFIVLELEPGEYSYKFHRGSWKTVEKGMFGAEIPDRNIEITADTVITQQIDAYRDQMLIDKWFGLGRAVSDTSLVVMQFALSSIYGLFQEWYDIDSALYYNSEALRTLQRIKANPALQQWIKLRYSEGFVFNQELMATLQQTLGNYPKALEIRLENLKLAEQGRDTAGIVNVLSGIASLYFYMRDYSNLLSYGKKMIAISQGKGSTPALPEGIMTGSYNVARGFYYLKQTDSALSFAEQAYMLAEESKNYYQLSLAGLLLGDIHLSMEETIEALKYYHPVLELSTSIYALDAYILTMQGLARAHAQLGNPDVALYYGRNSLEMINQNQIVLKSYGYNPNSLVADFAPFMASMHKQTGHSDSAYYYLNLSVALKDSLFTVDKISQFQNLTYNESLRKDQEQAAFVAAKEAFFSRLRTQGMIAGIVVLFVAAFYLFRNNLQKQKANRLLHQQKKAIEQTLKELKDTQNQLVQSEKMASLGELTAGIAHEIQNPLNFVNNFSEVNKELIGEIRQEIAKGNMDEVLVLTKDLEDNEDKINYHGKRADAIVKSMLQHSRNSSGQKEPSDINALSDEYLRLAFHGLRAKDKSFNVMLHTEFDPNVGMVKIVPQELGRVLLNLFNNAFYAVTDKKKTADAGYHPEVSLITKKVNGRIHITVKDNGSGIPESLKQKVFQPFFTTKPTGQGTGLGLSLAYDIITKGHGGEMVMDSKEGEGTTFILILPA
jgi:two-component system NtrC family sensor kinase